MKTPPALSPRDNFLVVWHASSFYTRITLYYNFRIACMTRGENVPGITPPLRLQEDIYYQHSRRGREGGSIAKYPTYENRRIRFSLYRFAITKVVYCNCLGQVTIWYVIYTYTIYIYTYIPLYAWQKEISVGQLSVCLSTGWSPVRTDKSYYMKF